MVAGNVDDDGRSAELLSSVLDRLRDDPSQDVEAIVRQHPTHADEIRQLAEVIRLVRENADEPAGDALVDAADEGRVIGDFRLLREIGRGGMGTVYEAEQRSLGRRVALKMLSPGVRLSSRSVDRFRREVHAAGALHHTNIVPVYASGVWMGGGGDGVPYYAMQFVEGTSLAERIPQGDDRPPLDPRTVMRWGQSIADALDHAHRHGVLHRDVKPSNILIDRSEQAWITDFGLARFDAGVSITMTGDIVGTVRYMSPEQARGGRHVDERADLYALGATLFEAICGRPVFEGDDRDELLRRVLIEPAPAVRTLRPETPAACAAIIDRLLEKEPDRRYPSAAVLAEDIRRALAGEPMLLQPPGRLELARRFVARHRVGVALSALAAAVLLAFSAGTAILAVQLKSERDRVVEAAARAERVNQYLARLLSLAGPNASGREISMRDSLDLIVPEIDREFAADPETSASLRTTIARLYWQWGETRKARVQFELAYRRACDAHGSADPRTTAIGTEWARLLVFIGELADAAAVLERLDGTRSAVILARGELRFASERPDEALALGREAADAARREACANDEVQAKDLIARASLCLNDLPAAIVARREALALATSSNKGVAEAVYYLAATLVSSERDGDLAEARTLLVAQQERFETTNESGSLLAALNESILANLDDADGDLAGADRHFRRSLAIKRDLFGARHAEIASTLVNYAHFLGRSDRVSEAIERLDEAVEMQRELFGDGHARTIDAIERRKNWASGAWTPDASRLGASLGR